MVPTLRLACVSLTLPLLVAASQTDPADSAQKRVAAEIDRWSRFLHTTTTRDESWQQLTAGSESQLARAGQALRDGHPWLAMQRLADAELNLSATDYLQRCSPEQHADFTAFEAEWKRMGGVLADELGVAAPAELADVHPAVLRALGEISRLRVRAFYASSLEYAQSTEPKYGLFYMGQAQAARDFVSMCRQVGSNPTDAVPPLRSLAPELDALQRDLLVGYRPPKSLLLHGDFIAASSLIKEAVELDAAGLRFGALLRYLQAALQSAPLRPKPMASDELHDLEGVSLRLRGFEASLARAGVDHTIGRLFLDAAQSALIGPDAAPGNATTIALDVLPRYFAALEPPSPPTTKTEPRATVTLVRWPYT